MSYGSDKLLLGDVAAQLGFDCLTLAGYGFAFGSGRNDMADNDMRQWLAGMANE